MPRTTARSRLLTRLGWQANRLSPDEVFGHLATLPYSFREAMVTSPSVIAPAFARNPAAP